ncbi:MAG: hypothetical protein CFE26_00875 [Verrucomicrobiales bacterium VVV1]|nr:MAG: hypothetical protein CFE26_00875 [Verrucomicrobiales bacterium VVV1]
MIPTRLRNPFSLSFARLGLLAILCVSQSAFAANDPLPGWKHTGVMAVLTTPDGANLPTGAAVEDFPLLVRLNGDWFNFAQAKPDGADLRFTTEDGKPLPHQIEQWDATGGTASIWVRMPRIEGNKRLPLRLHWGNPTAPSVSDGKAVFSESNGYLSALHLSETVRDEVGVLEAKDSGTTATAGVIGMARHFNEGSKISLGDKIAGLPTESAPHTTELWFRAQCSNANLVGWGNQKQQGKVVMQFSSPPHINMDCWFSDGNVSGSRPIALNEWNHAVFAYESGNARIYVNGVLDAQGGRGTPLKLQSPANLTLGSWSGESNFIGDLDEVRLSKVTRSADWVKLQYENQKPLQTLVGPLMRTPGKFSLTPATTTVPEGGKARFTAKADGALKLYWSLRRDMREEVVAVDRYTVDFSPGRVVHDTSMGLQLKAVYADRVEIGNITIAVKKTIPDPEFTLAAPEKWDGRTPIELVPRITNLAAMKKAGAGEVRIEWDLEPFAVTKEITPGKLRLLRAQNSGVLQMYVRLSNGGQPVSRYVSINVTQPASDAWVVRTPEREEKPEEGQFYARDDRNEGTLFYNGTLSERADEAFLKVFADDKLFATVKAKPAADLSYALTAKLKPGLIRYRVEFGTLNGGKETIIEKIGDLVCGDAFLIEGQSNALATDTREESPPETNEWIRSYGRPSQNPKENEGNLWCRPVWKARKGEKAELGWWGMELAKRLLESQKMPIFILNGAVGGTRIDQHQRNASNPTDLETIYGRMLWRMQRAKMTHGIRGVLWHQGESDQGASGPTGGYGWESYQPLFIDMSAAWKQDFPNVSRYYVFQIWPNSCAMGGKDGAGDRLREKQRTLPQLFSNMSIMSTLGIRPEGGCHYPLIGWAEFARLIQPVIERDFYGLKPDQPVTPPNLKRAIYASDAPDTILLEFDQPVQWLDAYADQFYLDGEPNKIASGSVSGFTLRLKMKESVAAKTITYLKEAKWSQDKLLLGNNGLAALTFCEVPIAGPPK